MQFQILKPKGVPLSLLIVTLLMAGCGDGFNTELKLQSDQLHSGMTFQEVTNSLGRFEILDFTNYPTPEQRNWMPRSEHDYVEKVYNKNLASTSILFQTPHHRFGWRDTCRIAFDAEGVIVGYTWMYPH